MATFKKQARQGDVFLVRVEKLPENTQPIPRENGRNVLAHGEHTGHAHAISEKHVQHFKVDNFPIALKDESQSRQRAGGGVLAAHSYLEVQAPAEVVHDEHEKIDLTPGFYEVRRQREYVRGQLRNVAD